MLKTISEPRAEYKPHVPRIIQIVVPGEFIGAIIGKGGEVIQDIQKQTDTSITITESKNDKGEPIGLVDIFGVDKEKMDAALDRIKAIIAVPEVGEIYKGKVVSIVEFGAFIEILPGKDGLLHISEMDWGKTEKVEDLFKLGDEVEVKLIEIDPKTNKLRLSRRALLEKPEGYVEPVRRPRPSGPRPHGGHSGGGERSERKGGFRKDFNKGKK